MSIQIPDRYAEAIVGAPRHPYLHLGRGVSFQRHLYILHSEECRRNLDDLRECRYSLAFDNGLSEEDWREYLDRTVGLYVSSDKSPSLLPLPYP